MISLILFQLLTQNVSLADTMIQCHVNSGETWIRSHLLNGEKFTITVDSESKPTKAFLGGFSFFGPRESMGLIGVGGDGRYSFSNTFYSYSRKATLDVETRNYSLFEIAKHKRDFEIRLYNGNKGRGSSGACSVVR